MRIQKIYENKRLKRRQKNKYFLNLKSIQYSCNNVNLPSFLKCNFNMLNHNGMKEHRLFMII